MCIDSKNTEYFCSFNAVKKLDQNLIEAKGLVVALTQTINNAIREVMRQYVTAGKPTIYEEMIISLFDTRPGRETICLINESELGDLEILPEFNIDCNNLGIQVTLKANLESQSVEDLNSILEFARESLVQINKREVDESLNLSFLKTFRDNMIEKGYTILEHYKFHLEENHLQYSPLTEVGIKILVRNLEKLKPLKVLKK